MIPKSIKHTIEAITENKIVDTQALSGGCIANAQIITLENDIAYFLKHSSGTNFQIEARGLSEIQKSNSIRVPKVISVDDDYLLLEMIETGHKSKDFFSIFGKQLAQMHRFTSKTFGLDYDNYVGSSPQKNCPPIPSWPQFYYHYRLLFQLELAQEKGLATKELSNAIKTIGQQIDDLLATSCESPTLIHGDLWGGNYLVAHDGAPVLIDPAVYYGHREAELAMTKLFGGFPDSFYESYQKEFPLTPGYLQREGLYKLYHMLNHLNLFGRSYYSSTLSLALQYSN